jgi:hypothetical protein
MTTSDLLAVGAAIAGLAMAVSGRVERGAGLVADAAPEGSKRAPGTQPTAAPPSEASAG